MIGFFPESYPDELLFSILSRYHRRMGYRDAASTARDLFGREVIRPSVDLPANLGELVSRLPPGHGYSVARLIDSHTLLPIYSPFVPAPRLEQIRADMEGSGGARLHSRLGINTFKGTPRTLKYCHGCVEQDRNLFGETYWHRLHQAAVEVCPTHQCYLIDSGVHLGVWGRRDALITAEEAIDTSTLSDKVRDQYFPIRLRIAEGAAWLLQNPMGGSGELGHRDRYLSVFFKKGSCTYSGCFRSGFLEEVREFYSVDFLASIHCPLTPTNNWAQRLVRRRGLTQHPLYHLLLIGFLGLTIQQFFELPEYRLPFGDGPWPCLNRTSQHFGQALITSYEVSATQRNGRTPRGTFRCDCGFAYSRIGPDKSEEDRYHIDGYVTFGDEWDNCVRERFYSGKYSRIGFSQELHVAPNTLQRQLLRLGLSSKPYRRAVTQDRRRKHVSPQTLTQTRTKNRELFLEAAKIHQGRTAIRNAVSTADTWLRKNDSEWWVANCPSRIFTKRTNYVDWKDRDSKWASAVLTEAKRILALPGRPVMASRTAILRSLKIVDAIFKRADKVPLTTQTLHTVCEDREGYAARRVKWAVEYFLERNICPTQSELCAKAGIGQQTTKPKKVAIEWAAAMAQFHPQLGLHYDAAA